MQTIILKQGDASFRNVCHADHSQVYALAAFYLSLRGIPHTEVEAMTRAVLHVIKPNGYNSYRFEEPNGDIYYTQIENDHEQETLSHPQV